MGLVEFDSLRDAHPVDLIEQVAHINEWTFERAGDDEIAISVAGSWTDYHVSISWMEEYEALHLACAFDMKIPPQRRAETQRLIALINEQLWIGHFDIWAQTGTIMFRQALPLPDGLSATVAQCEAMLVGAVQSCERYFPALQFVVWAGKSAQDAMNAAMFDTEGEA